MTFFKYYLLHFKENKMHMENDKKSLDNLSVLVFEVGSKKQKIGLNIFKTQEILTLNQYHKIPNSPKEIIGLMNLRGEILLILDLSQILYQQFTDIKVYNLIIICEHNQQKFALLVHNVSNIAEIEWKDLKSTQDIINSENNKFESLFEFEEDLISILNLELLFNKYFKHKNELHKTSYDFKKDTKNLKILILEDSETTKQILSRTLSQYNIEHFICENGAIALNHLEKKHNYNMILSDIEMPKMDGFSFLRELNTKKIKTPVVMYSSLSDQVTIEKAKKLGAKHFITKYNPNKILAAIEQYSN